MRNCQFFQSPSVVFATLLGMRLPLPSDSAPSSCAGRAIRPRSPLDCPSVDRHGEANAENGACRTRWHPLVRRMWPPPGAGSAARCRCSGPHLLRHHSDPATLVWASVVRRFDESDNALRAGALAAASGEASAGEACASERTWPADQVRGPDGGRTATARTQSGWATNSAGCTF